VVFGVRNRGEGVGCACSCSALRRSKSARMRPAASSSESAAQSSRLPPGGGPLGSEYWCRGGGWCAVASDSYGAGETRASDLYRGDGTGREGTPCSWCGGRGARACSRRGRGRRRARHPPRARGAWRGCRGSASRRCFLGGGWGGVASVWHGLGRETRRSLTSVTKPARRRLQRTRSPSSAGCRVWASEKRNVL